MNATGSHETITFENGLQVQVGKLIAEGGFSVVYETIEITNPYRAKTKTNGNRTRYALKRVLCSEDEIVAQCRLECRVHGSMEHPNIMPIVAHTFVNGRDGRVPTAPSGFRGTVCFMLFPYCANGSLRDEISRRNLLGDVGNTNSCVVRPWKEQDILEMFSGIVDGVKCMHQHGYTHRDIKLENVLLKKNDEHASINGEMYSSDMTPVLMDFGSAGPVSVTPRTRSILLSIVDEASVNSTVSYRAPELFDGGARHGDNEPDIDGKMDVWSLGCLLFGMMYGVSPFECEFRGEDVRVVECSQLRVLCNIPDPQPHTILSTRYELYMLQFVKFILVHDRSKRPTLEQVSVKCDELLSQSCGAQKRTLFEHPFESV